ncbi:MAG: M48 family metalloprotease [Lentisphaerae bacterium]|nr:M48 family metalloprotease [Lentisphaerota bacterium]
MSSLQSILAHAVVWKLGWVLVHSLWQAVAVAVVLAIVLGLLRKAAATTRYLVSCMALILMVALPVVTMWMVDAPATIEVPPIEPEMLESAALPVVDVAPLDLPVERGEASVAPAIALEMPKVVWFTLMTKQLENSLPYLVVTWLFGVFGLSLWHLGGWAQLQRLKRQMIQPVADELRERANALADRLHIRQAVAVVQSALVQVPTVVGWLRPVILLPASALTGLSTAQLEALLAHELAHIRRHDYLVNLLQTAIDILGFYHPAIWWASHRIRIERENCCDDMAAGIAGDRVLYADALATMEELRGRPGLAMAASGGSLFARIRRLAGKEEGQSKSGWIPAVAAVALVAAIVATGATRAQPAAEVVSEAGSIAAVDETHTTSQVALEFRLAERESGEGLTEAVVEGSDQKVWLHDSVEVSNEHVASARVLDQDGKPIIELLLTEEGAQKFEELTRRNKMKVLAILVNGKLLCAPVIREQIYGRKAQISGLFSRDEAERIAAGLAMQPWPPPQDRLKFGPVIELTVNDAKAEKACFVDFDDGTLVDLPQHDIDDWKEMFGMLARNGIDAAYDSSLRNFAGLDMFAVEVQERLWGTPAKAFPDMSEIGKAGTPCNMSAKGVLPATFIFRTREGGRGLLQLVALVDEPQGIRIRYKLIQGGGIPLETLLRTALQKDGAVVLSVKKDGALSIAGHQVDSDDVELIGQMSGLPRKRLISIEADRDVQPELVPLLVDACTRAGFERVGLSALKEYGLRFSAQASVYLDTATATPSEAFFAAEEEKVQAVARSVAGEDVEATVIHVPNTQIIRVVVTMPDYDRVSDVCNRIAEAYVAESLDGVRKLLVNMAGLPLTVKDVTLKTKPETLKQTVVPVQTVTMLSPLDMSKADGEVATRYTAAHPEIQEYVLWTAKTFGRSGMWLNEGAFAGLSGAKREKKIQYLAALLNDSEYGRHLCRGLAEASALKDARLVPGLMKVAGYHRDSGNYDCRPKWIAVSALARQEADEAVPLLISLVDHGNQNTRKWARAALSRKTGQDCREDKQAWAEWWQAQGHDPVEETFLQPWQPVAGGALPTAPEPVISDAERMVRAALEEGETVQAEDTIEESATNQVSAQRKTRSKGVSYAERIRRRREENAKRHQMKTALPFPSTMEVDDQPAKEGVLPPLSTSASATQYVFEVAMITAPETVIPKYKLLGEPTEASSMGDAQSRAGLNPVEMQLLMASDKTETSSFPPVTLSVGERKEVDARTVVKYAPQRGDKDRSMESEDAKVGRRVVVHLKSVEDGMASFDCEWSDASLGDWVASTNEATSQTVMIPLLHRRSVSSPLLSSRIGAWVNTGGGISRKDDEGGSCYSFSIRLSEVREDAPAERSVSGE